jgi:phosphate transport system permease protein
MDRLARRTVVLGGMGIIASILAILGVIVAEVVPLFRPPEATFAGTAPAPAGAALPPLLADVDEYREIAWILDAAGVIRFASLTDAAPPEPVTLAGLAGGAPVSASAAGDGHFALGTADGRVLPFRATFETVWEEGRRRVAPRIEEQPALAVDPEGRRGVTAAACATRAEDGMVCAALLGPREIVLVAVRERRALIGDATREETRQALPAGFRGEARGLAIDGRGDDLFVGTSLGQVVRYDLRDRSAPRLADVVQTAARPGTAVTVLGFLLGDRTLVAGDAAGGVRTWQVVRSDAAGGFRLVRANEFAPHAAPIVALSPSRRDKGFVTADAGGVARLQYGTSGETILEFAGAPPRAVVLAPKGDGLLMVDGNGVPSRWEIRNPHPEASLGTLFGRVAYEGYDRPEWVWQSTGGTDDFEGKFSLTPLIFGTLKGTFYALLFAVPLALLGALYASQFMHPAIRAVLKPAVEIMAALPSVVLGFVAGLWLAPAVERLVPGLALAPLTITGIILLGAIGWRLAPAPLRGRLRPGSEVLLLLPLVLLGAWIAFALGARLEQTLLAGDYRSWILGSLGLAYDQRNSIVVGIAMGFAVIPVIFTIAEDALANVPQHLTAGSLALGATRWQTALRVVLPTASPGIFSAVMIGFGRAVGETMIVLMATGNTPVMNLSPFNGFRALSANIAVELPEAPEGGTLFRVLFLAALLLFALTFAVNTAAEVVRLKLRERYRYL